MLSQSGRQILLRGRPGTTYSRHEYAYIMNAEKSTISMQIASAFSPSAMFVSVQYCVGLITRPSRASNCTRRTSAAQTKREGRETYDEALVEGEHDDELDGQELGERLPALELVLRQAVEDEQAVQRDAASP